MSAPMNEETTAPAADPTTSENTAAEAVATPAETEPSAPSSDAVVAVADGSDAAGTKQTPITPKPTNAERIAVAKAKKKARKKAKKKAKAEAARAAAAALTAAAEQGEASDADATTAPAGEVVSAPASVTSDDEEAKSEAPSEEASTAAIASEPAATSVSNASPTEVPQAAESADDTAVPAAPEEAAEEVAAEEEGFARLGLHPRLLRALDRLGFKEPTPIQAQAIPPLLDGADMIGRARTGSGKTAAFGLPLLQRVAKGPGPGAVRALVLAPTRELALQVTEAMRGLAEDLKLTMVTVYGGSAYGPQLAALRRGVEIVVGTPGRLIDLLDKGALSLSDVEMVVLDEADEMLRMGFVDDVERMLAETPQRRQVALFSATMPPQIRRVADKHLRNPVIIEAEGGGPSVDHIAQQWLRVPQRFKAEALLRVLQAHTTGAALVFARTKAGCDAITGHIRRSGLDVDALHGDLNQSAREQVVARLRDRQTRFVIATDVAARGIDVEHITLVVNLDIPDNAEVYTHRIGRTGRAGRAGRALSLITPNEVGRYRGQMRQLRAKVEQTELPTQADVLTQQLDVLGKELGELLTTNDPVAARAWLGRLTSDEERSAEDVAAAALMLLSAERGIDLVESPSTQLPDWARMRSDRSRHQQNDWDRGPRRGDDRQRPQRPQRPRGGDVDHVDLFLPIGRMHRIRPGDLVGALANEAGVPGQAIGRITVRDRVSFVSVPRQLAQQVVSDRETLELRGMQVPVMIARPQSGGGGGGGGGGGDRPRPPHGPGPQRGYGDRKADQGSRPQAQRPYPPRTGNERPYDPHTDRGRGAPPAQGHRGKEGGYHRSGDRRPPRGPDQSGGQRWSSRRAPGDRPFKRRKPK